MQPPQSFFAELRALDVDLSATQVEKLGRFVELLLAANARMNLTAIRDAQSAWSRHVLDSLSLLPQLPDDPGARVIDVGAGGGLPGLVLGIARPQLDLTLVDATGKKVRHIAQTAEALGLERVRALQARAEDLAGVHSPDHREHRERYDVAVARALAPMPVLVELLGPLVKVGGVVLAIKGERAEEELHDAQRAMSTVGLAPGVRTRTATGTIVRLDKTAPTPRSYPRRPGEPKRAPIR